MLMKGLTEVGGGLVDWACGYGGVAGYTGKLRDNETGLDFFGARYFSGAQGRFTTPDWSARPEGVPYAVLSDPQTLNQYAYVRNNPLSRPDPDGHCGVDMPNCQKLQPNPAAVPAPVKQAIDNSVKASNGPTADDPKGGSHEEGGVAYTKNGVQTVAPAAPGAFKDVKEPGKAEINPNKAADPALQKPGDVTADVAWHVHPSATADTTSTNAQGQTVLTHSFFKQPPSPGDIQGAFPAPTTNIVVGARDQKVYVYTGEGPTCKESLKDFNKQ
ncbi:MAG: RHS repeat-associated core domain-containing protein [Bryobacteraceae bacterium]